MASYPQQIIQRWKQEMLKIVESGGKSIYVATDEILASMNGVQREELYRALKAVDYRLPQHLQEHVTGSTASAMEASFVRTALFNEGQAAYFFSLDPETYQPQLGRPSQPA